MVLGSSHRLGSQYSLDEILTPFLDLFHTSDTYCWVLLTANPVAWEAVIMGGRLAAKVMPCCYTGVCEVSTPHTLLSQVIWWNKEWGSLCSKFQCLIATTHNYHGMFSMSSAAVPGGEHCFVSRWYSARCRSQLGSVILNLSLFVNKPSTPLGGAFSVPRCSKLARTGADHFDRKLESVHWILESWEKHH